MGLVVIVACVWLLWAWCSAWVLRGDVRGESHDPGSADHEPVYLALAYRFAQVWCRLVHDVRGEGLEHVPHERTALVIVANHTAGLDPVLIQTQLRVEVRWMMAKDMRIRGLEHVWSLLKIIEVDRQAVASGKRDTRSLRTAISHLKQGGVIGIFPQGKIVRPGDPRVPFQHGAAMLAIMAGAPILPAHIRGTPATPTAWQSLWTRSASRVRFGPLMRPNADDTPETLTARVEAWFAAQD